MIKKVEVITPNNEIFNNRNGLSYRVLAKCPFNSVDAEYYKDSWQKYMYALLESENNNFVVASCLGSFDWGNGMYFNDLSKAHETFNKKVENYMRG